MQALCNLMRSGAKLQRLQVCRPRTAAPWLHSRSHGTSGFLKTLFDMEEQEELEREEDNFIDPDFPILSNRYSDLFYMPHSVGPAYQCLLTTADHFYIVDRYSANLGGGRVESVEAQTVRCPHLLLPYMKRMFSHPYLDFKNPINFSIVNLNFRTDVDSAIKAFVLIASQYSLDIWEKGYWADFVNPFTGRAYFRSVAGRKLIKEARFLGHNMVFEDINGCTVIKEANKCKFAGAIFTDAPPSYFGRASCLY